jgi:hypothetical protein
VASARECGRNFDQQGRFADAGIAAEEQHRAAHQSAAGDAVELGDAAAKARRLVCFALERFNGEESAFACRSRPCLGALLDERVPGAARIATAGPSRGRCATALANEIMSARNHRKIQLDTRLKRRDRRYGNAGRGG